MQDLRYAIRTLRNSPGFALIAVLVLGLGIGANTAIFTAVDRVLLRPLPYGDPGRLVVLWEDFSFVGFPRNNPSPADYMDWLRQNTMFEDIAAIRYRSANLTSDGPPERLPGKGVTANLFRVLRTEPLLGRAFTEEEDRTGAPVVVISYGLWQRRFAGDPRVVGKSILMNGIRTTVLGVMPAWFTFPERDIEYWCPANFTPQDLANRHSHFLNTIARLKPGVSLEQARAEMSGIGKRLERAYPKTNLRVGVFVIPFHEEVARDARPTLVVLLAAAGCVLLIACSNIANLLLARALGRSREIAVRMALGANRRRLVRQTLTESILLSCCGCGVGLLFAQWGMGLLENLVPANLPASLRFDARVLGFAAAIAIVTGVLFGLAPAFQNARTSLSDALKQGGRTGTGHQSKMLRNALVVTEIALALVLLVGAGLMLQTLGQLRSTNTGFRPDHLLTMQTVLPRQKYSEDSQRLAYFDSVLDRLRVLPGVAGAGFASDLPFTSMGDTNGFRIEGRPAPASDMDLDALYREVTNDYLQAIGAQLLEGRFFEKEDRAQSLKVVIINETFAKEFWPAGGAIGKRIQVGDTGPAGPWRTIAGVVKDVRERGLLAGMKPAVYLPVCQVSRPEPFYLAVRTAGDPLALVNAVRQTIWSVDREQPVSEVASMQELMEQETVNRREALVLLAAFAGLALLLASLGIYGVLSYAVAQQTQEIGVRIALGANHGHLIWSVMRQGLSVAGVGVALGTLAALALTRIMSGLLYGVSATDPLTFVTVAIGLGVVAAMACYLPARRASRLDPIVALKYE